MSFFVDDGALRLSIELTCDNDPKQRAFKGAVNRSIAYAGQGVTPVAAAGNAQKELEGVRLLPGNVDGFAARQRRRGADREPDRVPGR